MNVSDLPDIQSGRSTHSFELTRVGVTGVLKPVTVHRPSRPPHTLLCTFDVAVDLPANQRGTHLSRNVEAINAAIDDFSRKATRGLEELGETLVRSLLERHTYANRAEVTIEADYFRERKTPLGARSLERYHLVAGAHEVRGESPWRFVGTEVIGMTACPCAMEGTRTILSQSGKTPTEGPSVTHNQRNRVFLRLELPSGDVDAEDLAEICESALSAPTFEYLKRGDEAMLVLQAHNNPRFVEDVVREVLAGVLRTYPHLPSETRVLARSIAEESIHKHNAYAERMTTLGELRARD